MDGDLVMNGLKIMFSQENREVVVIQTGYGPRKVILLLFYMYMRMD